MSDHLAEALRLVDWANEPGHDTEQRVDEDAAIQAAQVHATLEVAEHVEFAGEQLRRLADGVEQIVELVRATWPDAVAAYSKGRLDERAATEPCAYYFDGVGVVRCGILRAEHGAVRDHEWVGARTHGPGGPLVPTGESGVSASPDGGR